jgi:hypothetical protein
VRGALTSSPSVYAISVQGGKLSRLVTQGRAVTWGR